MINKSLFLLFYSIIFASCAQLQKKNDKDLVFFENKSKDVFGGFSGLQYLPEDSTEDQKVFLTITDRGPNGEDFDFVYNSKPSSGRVFKNPNFNPHLIKFKISGNKAEVIETMSLKNTKGDLLTGLPNSASRDEVPMNDKNQILNFDFLGIDPEALAIDQNKNIWVGEEYRPSILKFSKDGILIKRFVPKNSFNKVELKKIAELYGDGIVQDSLPEILNKRNPNRGFEAIGIHKDNLYFMTQSTLLINERSKKESSVVRIFAFDINSEKIVGQYLFKMEDPKNKIGDMTINSLGEVYILEQDGKIGEKGFRRVFKVKLEQTLNTLGIKLAKHPEELRGDEQLKAYKFLPKQMVLDLTSKGFNFAEKVEGIALMPNKKLAVVNDNDFAIDAKKSELENKTGIGVYFLNE